MREKYFFVLLMLFCCGLAQTQAQANTVTYDITHNGRNAVERVQITPDHRATYTYRENGQLSHAYLQGPTSQPGGQEPTASFTVTPAIGATVADNIQFDASASSDPQDSAAALLARWDFDGNGTWDTLFSLNKTDDHQFAQPGDYPVRLEIKDSNGYSVIATKTVRIFSNTANTPPTAVLGSSIGSTVVVGTPVTFSAAQSSDADGEIIAYSWSFGDGTALYEGMSKVKIYNQTGSFTITLTVTDDRGAIGTATKNITVVPDTGPQAPTIATQTSQTSFTVNQGDLLNIALNVQDADTGIGELSLMTNGAIGSYIAYDYHTYHFYWRPAADQSGTFTVTLAVYDPEGPTASLTLNITVNTVSDPGVLQWQVQEEASPLTLATDASSMTLAGNYLYLSGSSSLELQPVDISNRANPILKPNVSVSGSGKDTAVAGNYVYVAAYKDGLQVYTAGAYPSFVAEVDPYLSGNFYTALVSGSTAFGLNSDGTLYLFNVVTPSNPTEIKNIPGISVGSYRRKPAAATGPNYLYLPTTSGVKVVDFRTPSAASLVGTVISGDANSLAVLGNMLYVALNNELRLYNISNRTSPSLLASKAFATTIEDVTVDSNGRVFVHIDGYSSGNYSYPVYLLERSSSTFTILNQLDLGDNLYSMKADGDYLYASYKDKLYVYRYRQVTNHRPLAYNQNVTVQTGQALALALTGSDPDGDPLSFEFESTPMYGSISGTPPNLTYTAPASLDGREEGEDAFRFYVNDGSTDSFFATVAIDVVASPRPPVITSIGNKSVNEGETLAFSVTATDPDFGDTVTVTAGGLPAGAEFVNNQFAWVPAAGQASGTPYTVTFTATDSTGRDSTLVSVNITVNHINEPPIISLFSVTPGSGFAPLAVFFTLQAHDPDGSIASTSIQYGDGNAGSSTGHTYQNAGTFTAHATVTDNNGATASREVNISAQVVQHGTLLFGASQVTVAENGALAAVTVRRINGSQGPVTVQCVRVAGTALAGSDFVAGTQMLTWSDGDSTAKNCSVDLVDDTVVEGTEYLNLSLQNPSGGATLGTPAIAKVNISNDDVLALEIDQEELAISEGDDGTFRVRLTAQPSSQVSVVTAKQAGGDPDLNIATGAGIVFDTGNWNQYQPVTIAAAEDVDTVEGQAVFQVVSSGLSTKTVTTSELDNDTLGLLVTPQELNVTEGSSAVFSVQISAQPEEEIAVSLAITGDASLALATSSLNFNQGTWNTPVQVQVSSTGDADLFDGVALVVLSSGGLEDASLTIHHLEDLDRDGKPDSTDSDDDNDGVDDGLDNCPRFKNVSQADTDGDGAGDVCDQDADNDGIVNADDTNQLDPQICRDADTDTCDDCSAGTDGYGPLADYDSLNDGLDTDTDGQCDIGDNDDDDDGIWDTDDNCPLIENTDQADSNGDGVGDVCTKGSGWLPSVFMLLLSE